MAWLAIVISITDIIFTCLLPFQQSDSRKVTVIFSCLFYMLKKHAESITYGSTQAQQKMSALTSVFINVKAYDKSSHSRSK